MTNASRWGAELRLDSDLGFTTESAITGLVGGGFVATWTAFPDGATFAEIHAQVLNADGSRRGDEFVVDPSADHQQITAAVTALANGSFVIAWQESNPGGLDALARIFDRNGVALSAPFSLDATLGDRKYFPDLAALPDGGFVAAWQSYTMFGADVDVVARVFNSDGTPRNGTGSFQANTTNSGYAPDVAVLSDGRIAITWEDQFSAYGRVLHPDGTPDGAAFSLNTTHGNASNALVMPLANGTFVATWIAPSIASDSDIYTQFFDANGAKSGAEIRVNTTTIAPQFDPAMAQLADGRLLFAWADRNQNGENGGPPFSNIRLQIINADGSKSGDELVVNESAIGHGHAPAITALADGRFVVSWDDRSPAGGAEGLGEHAQIFDPRTSGVKLDGTPLDDDWVGTPFNDVLRGAGGNDRIDGGAGVDTVQYAGPRDQYTITDLGDRFVVAGPEGTDTLLNIEYIQFDPEPLKPTSPRSPGGLPSDDVSGLFDTRYYLGRYADVSVAGVSAIDHYNAFGWHEGRDPNAYFDSNGYLAANPDVRASGVNPMEHYHAFGWRDGRDPSAGFDTTLYLVHNPDVAAAGVDPLEHYLQHGMAEGRAIHAAVGNSIVGGFDAEYYAFHNPDVAAAGIDSLTHYNSFGWHEGRNPNGWFDTAGYLAHYADVAASGANPLDHYMLFGWKEGRDASAAFDTLGYLAANPDVAAADVNPLEHFLKFGIYEGREAVSDGLWH